MTTGRLAPFILLLRREGDAAILDKNGKTVLVINPDRDLEDDEASRIAKHVFAMLSAAPAPEGGATGAQAVIRNGQIVISVDVDALPLILSGSIALNAVAGTFKVTDAATFAKEVCYVLNAEKEDGTTRVHMMFDSAFNHAIDQGAEGVDEINEDEFEAEAARLQAEAQAALATHEEAPAEAGEQWLWRVPGRGWVLCDREDDVVREVRVGSEYVETEVVALSALRAQPPAREDAQPVAWRMRHVDGSGGKGPWKLAAHHPSGPRVEVQPLYTHPAPDALRGAVEALEFYRDAWNSEPNGDPRIEGDASGSLTEPADALLDDKGTRASVALTALQAEQKGGA